MRIGTINTRIEEIDSIVKTLKVQIDELEAERDKLVIEKYYIRHPEEERNDNL